MKKIFFCLMAVIIIVVMCTACSGNENSTADNKLSIVSTIFPQYDWVRHILGDKAENTELTLLLDNGVDLHSYQPTVNDIAKISTCDIFIYVGGESDDWVKDALKTAVNKDMIVINLLDILGDSVKEEEIKDGMEHDHEHDEIDTESVGDRPLSDWIGNWTTIENAMNSNVLDEYITYRAEENKTDFNSQKASYTELWKSNYKTLQIADKSVTFGNISTNYNYIGYKIIEDDYGDSVWYGFKAETPTEEIPTYIAFSDYKTGIESENNNVHEEADHFHFRYGNDSFEALTLMKNWTPTYFTSNSTTDEIIDTLNGYISSDTPELDEHVWLSLKNAQVLCTHIADKLCELDPDNTTVYKSNTKKYNDSLDILNDQYKQTVSSSSYKTILFGDRFPFRYLIDDYGLDYFAAFPGCSTESAASFDTIIFLSGKIDQLNLKNIMVTETSDQSIARTIIQNTKNKDQEILVLNSMQSITSDNISSGVTYLSIMESNLEVIKKALN